MTKVHGKRYAYKFDFQGLAAATQPATSDPSSYKYQSELFMSSYHHSAKLGGFMGPHAAIPSSAGEIFFKFPIFVRLIPLLISEHVYPASDCFTVFIKLLVGSTQNYSRF